MKHFGTATGDSQIKCARFVDFMRGCGCSRAILKSDEPTIVGFETLKNAWPLGIVLDKLAQWRQLLQWRSETCRERETELMSRTWKVFVEEKMKKSRSITNTCCFRGLLHAGVTITT